MNPPRDHPSSRGRRSQSQRVSEAVDDVPRRWRPRAPRTGGPGARRSAEKRLRRKRFGYAEAQICTHSRTQATVTRRNRGRSTKSRRRLTPQRGAHAARTLTPFCPLGPKVKFCFHSATRARDGTRPHRVVGPNPIAASSSPTAAVVAPGSVPKTRWPPPSSSRSASRPHRRSCPSARHAFTARGRSCAARASMVLRAPRSTLRPKNKTRIPLWRRP